MILSAYLAERGESQAAFARRASVSRQIVSDWIACRRFPSRRNIVAVRIATGEKVRALDWETEADERTIIKVAKRTRV
jgi:transcriptional regulator with XRE-family HTH domain